MPDATAPWTLFASSFLASTLQPGGSEVALEPAVINRAKERATMSQGCRKCWIYRSSRKDEMYLYLGRKDGFEAVPASLMRLMGRAELVMELDLHPGRRLARTCVDRVLTDLEARGFHLQLPPAGPSPHAAESAGKPDEPTTG